MRVIIVKQLEMISYWVETSNKDYKTMINLYESKDYHWCLFIGHLVIEKLLKAIYINNINGCVNPPRTHDLLMLADKANIDTTEKQKDLLDMVTTFNISARYPDYKKSFYNKCTQEFTYKIIEEIKEMRRWLLSAIENK